MKQVPTEPTARYRYFQMQVALLKQKRAPESLIAACRAKVLDAKRQLSKDTP